MDGCSRICCCIHTSCCCCHTYIYMSSSGGSCINSTGDSGRLLAKDGKFCGTFTQAVGTACRLSEERSLLLEDLMMDSSGAILQRQVSLHQ
ncbi:hypothetical protein DUNSADRAFT_15 [Dunaliella salina]|uniref:Encoded protein n=1 Tax=Dunaliella salina TaxID=3046 RepID=A0ABQ7HAK9_DUNSA|nr:hypothetical protein DUNSADRAFT_15 [Dunaliella salina]|eukprot:KAF5843893.1 hypothetical protein DUNSADRAFT_15 [Dunaliella salina]